MLNFISIFLSFCIIPCYYYYYHYYFQKQSFHWFSLINKFALLILFFTRCYILSTCFFSIGQCILLPKQRHTKKPRQDNQREKYCPLFHLFKWVISKRYNLGRTSILNHDKINHSSWQNGEVCRSHCRFNIQSFLLNLAILFYQCIAKTNWKILKSSRHIFADVLNTWILNFEGCLYIFIDIIYIYIYI